MTGSEMRNVGLESLWREGTGSLIAGLSNITKKSHIPFNSTDAEPSYVGNIPTNQAKSPLAQSGIAVPTDYDDYGYLQVPRTIFY
jgi:hypothetical protein